MWQLLFSTLRRQRGQTLLALTGHMEELIRRDFVYFYSYHQFSVEI
jgi:hypothetical protein